MDDVPPPPVPATGPILPEGEMSVAAGGSYELKTRWVSPDPANPTHLRLYKTDKATLVVSDYLMRFLCALLFVDFEFFSGKKVVCFLKIHLSLSSLASHRSTQETIDVSECRLKVITNGKKTGFQLTSTTLSRTLLPADMAQSDQWLKGLEALTKKTTTTAPTAQTTTTTTTTTRLNIRTPGAPPLLAVPPRLEVPPKS
jgi:hypothetical protein